MTDKPVFVYDGECGFCSSCARAIIRWIPTPAAVVPWQRLDLGSYGLTESAANESVQWVRPGRSAASGALAFAYLLQSSSAAWRLLGRWLAWSPVQRIAQPTYELISRNRHRLPGGTPTCRLDR